LVVNYRLFTPGPVEVADEVLAENGKRFPYHRDRTFAEVVERVTVDLKDILFTDSRIFFFTSSGTGGMQAALVNLFSEGDEVLVTSIGKFGQRWKELADVYRLKVTYLPFEFGQTVDPAMVDDALRTNPNIKAVLSTFTETSTGAKNDVKAMGEIVRHYERVFVLDSIAGLIADELRMDAWNVDAAIGGSQKAIGAPPGLSLVALNERAWEFVQASTMPNYYFSMKIAEKFRKQGFTPWTPAITAMMSLALSLKRFKERGIENVWADHERWASFFREKSGQMGFEFLPKNPSNALSVIKMPDGVDSTPIIREIKEAEGILFANGQAELKGRLIRVGHMGHANEQDTLTALRVLERHALPKIKGL
jgi:aspartate aminotransferase-like enzyme